MLFSFSAVQRRKKFTHLPLGLRTRAQTHLCDRSPLAPPRAPRTAGGYAAPMAAPQNPSSGGATASFDASMTRTRCRSCSPATSSSTTSKLLSANLKRRRSDTRSLRGAQKHLYACRPRGATARRWRWTLPTPPPKTTRMSERRDRRRPAETANSDSAGRADAQPRLNVFYIPKDGACPKLRCWGRQKAIKTN